MKKHVIYIDVAGKAASFESLDYDDQEEMLAAYDDLVARLFAYGDVWFDLWGDGQFWLRTESIQAVYHNERGGKPTN